MKVKTPFDLKDKKSTKTPLSLFTHLLFLKSRNLSQIKYKKHKGNINVKHQTFTNIQEAS